jgi:hypothetical protein
MIGRSCSCHHTLALVQVQANDGQGEIDKLTLGNGCVILLDDTFWTIPGLRNIANKKLRICLYKESRPNDA